MATRTQVNIHQVLQSLNHIYAMSDLDDRILVDSEPISDVILAQIHDQLRKAGVKSMPAADDALITLAASNRYHPIRDYLNNLHWNGDGHIEKLACYFDNPDGLFKIFSRKFMIGAVRRVLVPGSQNRVLTLVGPQRIGKSKFAQWICPSSLRSKHYVESAVDPDNKDFVLRLATTWIWSLEELGSTTRRRDREALKAFLSREQINERMAYGRYPISKPALSNFIATSNENGVLSDPTGNKRYMVCRINSIDWQGYTSTIKVDDLWAEAVMAYYAGESPDLSTSEDAKADKNNAEFTVENPVEGAVLDHYKIDPKQTNWWTSSNEILAVISPFYKGSTDLASKRLSELMTELGCERKRGRVASNLNPTWGYVGVWDRNKP